MKLKRLIVIILVLSLAVVSFGCSKDEPDSHQGTPTGTEQQGTDVTTTPSGNAGSDVTNPGNSQGSAVGSDILGPSKSDVMDVQPDARNVFEIDLATDLSEYGKAYDALKEYHVNVPNEYKEYFDYAEKLRDIGVEYKSVGANIAGAYCIHYAGCMVTSVRNCIDEILKKRGISVEDGIYSDWKEIVSINYTCPAPYYMQSVYNVYAGDMDAAKEYYSLAKLNEEGFPDGIAKLENISSLSDDELKNLRNELVNFENYLYDIYTCIPTGWETTGYEFMPEFFVGAYYYCFEIEDYQNALVYADAAVRNNPLDVQLYKVAALTAMQIGDLDTAWDYISNGIMIDNAAGDIVTLAAAFWVSEGDYDKAKTYLDMARMGSVSAENEKSLKNVENKIKEAGR